MMVARPPPEGRRVNPTTHLEILTGRTRVDRDPANLGDRFGFVAKFDFKFAIRQPNRVSVGSIPLRVKAEIGREAFGLQLIDPTLCIAENKCGGRRPGVLVAHNPQRDVARRRAAERCRDFIAASHVLGALTQRKRKLRRLSTRSLAVKLDDPVSDREPAERRCQRLAIEELKIPACLLH